jgi:hypothetical protein
MTGCSSVLKIVCTEFDTPRFYQSNMFYFTDRAKWEGVASMVWKGTSWGGSDSLWIQLLPRCVPQITVDSIMESWSNSVTSSQIYHGWVLIVKQGNLIISIYVNEKTKRKNLYLTMLWLTSHDKEIQCSQQWALPKSRNFLSGSTCIYFFVQDTLIKTFTNELK